MIVIDASVLVEVLLRTATGVALEPRIRAELPFVCAPHLIDIEVAHVLRKNFLSRAIDADRGKAAFQDLAEFPVFRYPHTSLLTGIWLLRNNLTAYDAAYVELAELLQAPLLTRDRKLAASSGHNAKIEVF